MLRKYCYHTEAVTYLQQKYKWSMETFNTIHWEAHEANITNIQYKKWKQRIKLIHNHYAFGKKPLNRKNNALTVI